MRTAMAPEPISGWELLDHPRTPKTTWSITDKLAIELAEHLELTRPERILEIGSGFSTAILASYAARHGATVVSLEHHPVYMDRTRRGLEELGLADHVELRFAQLSKRLLPNGQEYFWYKLVLEDSFNFVFVDGPPKSEGRQGVFFEVADHLSPGWEMWLDDGKRAHEQKCIKLWRKYGSFSSYRRDIDGKGIYILRDDSTARQHHRYRQWHGKLGLGLLANGDHNWWQQVQELVDPELLAASHVVAATDGPLPGSLPFAVRKHLHRSGAVERRARRHGRRRPGDSSSRPRRLIGRLLHSAAQPSGVEYVLYLSDDWASQTLDDGWLIRSLEFLEASDKVDQVLLTHRIDTTSTGKEVRSRGMGFIALGERRCRDQPSLLRARSRATGGWRRLLRRRRSWSRIAVLLRLRPKLRTVQLSPGVFVRRVDRRKRPRHGG
jgi:precorrin-6B methylase 2